MSAKESLTEWWRERGGPVGTLMVAALIVGSSIGFAARADASPATDAYAAQYGTVICQVIDDYPTIGGLTGVLQGVMDHGFSAYDSGVAVATAVWDYCPRHLPLLNEFVKKFATKTSPVYVAGHVGGVLP